MLEEDGGILGVVGRNGVGGGGGLVGGINGGIGGGNGERWSVERRFRVTEVFLAVLWVCGLLWGMGMRGCMEGGMWDIC